MSQQKFQKSYISASFNFKKEQTQLQDEPNLKIESDKDQKKLSDYFKPRDPNQPKPQINSQQKSKSQTVKAELQKQARDKEEIKKYREKKHREYLDFFKKKFLELRMTTHRSVDYNEVTKIVSSEWKKLKKLKKYKDNLVNERTDTKKKLNQQNFQVKTQQIEHQSNQSQQSSNKQKMQEKIQLKLENAQNIQQQQIQMKSEAPPQALEKNNQQQKIQTQDQQVSQQDDEAFNFREFLEAMGQDYLPKDFTPFLETSPIVRLGTKSEVDTTNFFDILAKEYMGHNQQSFQNLTNQNQQVQSKRFLKNPMTEPIIIENSNLQDEQEISFKDTKEIIIFDSPPPKIKQENDAQHIKNPFVNIIFKPRKK